MTPRGCCSWPIASVLPSINPIRVREKQGNFIIINRRLCKREAMASGKTSACQMRALPQLPGGEAGRFSKIISIGGIEDSPGTVDHQSGPVVTTSRLQCGLHVAT